MNAIFQEYPFENGRPTTGGIMAGCDMRMGPGGHGGAALLADERAECSLMRLLCFTLLRICGFYIDKLLHLKTEI